MGYMHMTHNTPVQSFSNDIYIVHYDVDCGVFVY